MSEPRTWWQDDCNCPNDCPSGRDTSREDGLCDHCRREARSRADAIAAYLASLDAERALAEALEVDWTPFWNERRRGGVVEAEFDRPRFARYILAAWRERL